MREYKLERPILFGNKEIDILTLPDEIKAKHIKGVNLSKMMADDFIVLLSNLAKVPAPIIEEMAMSDFIKLSAEVGQLMGEGDGHQTGTT